MNKNLTAKIRRELETISPSMAWTASTMRMEFRTLEKYGVITGDELAILLSAIDGKVAPPAPEKNA